MLFAAIGLALLMLVMQWVYRSMQAPRLYMTLDPETGEPVTRWQSVVRYFVLLPFVATIWLLVLLTVLVAASGTRSAQSLALAAAAVIVGARMLAHTSPEASHELGKTLPLVVVSIAVIGGSSPAERMGQVLIEVVQNAGVIDTFIYAIIAVDIIVTWLWYWRERSHWRGEQAGTRRSEMRISFKPLTNRLRAIWNFGKPAT